MLGRIKELLAEGTDFAIETTLTTTTYKRTIEQAKTLGYEVTLLFFWLNSEELAISRVKQRVKEGGHNIPEPIIRRRYKRGIFQLLSVFLDICHNYMIIDNSREEYVLIAEKMGQKIHVHSIELFDLLKSRINEMSGN